MSTQNKLKLSIGTVAVLIIAFYTYCLFVYGGKYPDITVRSFKYNVEMLVITLWPLACYAIVKYFNIGNKIGFRPFVIDCVIYNIVTSGLIWLFEEIIFRYSYVSADVIAQMYMYVISSLTFCLYNINLRKIKPDKGDLICFTVIVGVTIFFWICNQERIATIVGSMSYERSAVDTDGEFLNWISHRLSMLQASLKGDFSNISIHRIQPMIKACSLAWLSDTGGWHITAVILILSVCMTCLMVIYSRKNDNVLTILISICFIIKIIIGLISNMFLIFSTSVGIPFIRTVYDVILLAVFLIYSADKN